MDDNKQKKPLYERIEDTLDEASTERRTPYTARKTALTTCPTQWKLRVAFAARSPSPTGATSPCGS